MNITAITLLVVASMIGILEIYGFFLLFSVLFIDYSNDADYFPNIKDLS